jgi:hypothetical protein
MQDAIDHESMDVTIRLSSLEAMSLLTLIETSTGDDREEHNCAEQQLIDQIYENERG